MCGVWLKRRRDGPTSSRVSSHLALDPWRREGPDRSRVPPASRSAGGEGHVAPSPRCRAVQPPGRQAECSLDKRTSSCHEFCCKSLFKAD